MDAGGNEMLDKSLQFVVSDGRPIAVILDIEVYREMLERLEDLEDLKALEEIRKKPMESKSLDEFLAEHDFKV
jgi:PHD/YefM family antitoxin component YafN of YafNO toxin-antitoxin module